MTRQTEMTKAKMIVFFFSCLLIRDMSFSAPGTVSSSFFSVEFVLRSLPVWPSSWAEAAEPTDMISLVKSRVRSRPCDSDARPLTRLLLTDCADRELGPLICVTLSCVLISFYSHKENG